jgi:lipid-A-disaccharide synthase
MKYYIVAGEASGDLHGSNLIKCLQKNDLQAQIRAWGGEKMAASGAVIVKHYRQLAFMGFIEVVLNIRKIWGFLKLCKEDILQYQPDVVILIDYPGFNIRIAEWAKSQGLKVVYYITPQVWAWNKKRVHSLSKNTDLLLVILPFEADFFAKFGYKATFVGHPLLDAVNDFTPNATVANNLHADSPILALLPGSRKQEIRSILPVMLEACKGLPYKVVIAGAPSIEKAIYTEIISKSGLSQSPVILVNETYTLLSKAKFALVASGTATLETALFNVPQIVCYKGNQLSFFLAKFLVDIKFISLVNLIADKEVVKELIQDGLSFANIRQELENLTVHETRIKEDYSRIRTLLGNQGASTKAAQEIQNLLKWT